MKKTSRQFAENFLRDQIRIMKKYGKTPKLSVDKKKKLLDDIEVSFEHLRPNSLAETNNHAQSS